MSQGLPLTQAEVDALVADRLAREREQSGLRILAAVTRERQRLQREHADQMAVIVTALTRRIRQLVAEAVAAELRFINPATAVRLAGLDDIEVNPLGQLDEAAVRDRLQDLATAEPYLTHPVRTHRRGHRPGGHAHTQ